jgi:hypothetical protein
MVGRPPALSLTSLGGVAVDSSGNVFIADTYNFVIREVSSSNINTVAGNYSLYPSGCTGGGELCGDGSAATSAGISEVFGLAVDGSGNVYIADSGNNSIREFSVGGNINTVAGSSAGSHCSPSTATCGDGGLATATGALLKGPSAVAVDLGGNIFIADTYDYRIREVSGGIINTVAGNGTECTAGGAFCGDSGLAKSAKLSEVYGVAVDSSDDIFIADYYNNAIREVTDSTANKNPVSGNINTVAGNGTCCFAGNGVPPTNASLFFPLGATSDPSGDIYIADKYNCVVREVSAGNITTFAGTPWNCGYGGDSGLATSALLNFPQKAVFYAGKVYISDEGNCVIRMVDTTTGDISTIAGTPGTCGYSGDTGLATSAQLNDPEGIAVDSSGNVYIATRATTSFAR